MASVAFTQNLRRQLGGDPGTSEVEAASVGEALEAVFARHPKLRSYILDDQGAVRKHVAVFLNGESVQDRAHLSDALPEDGEIFVMQALSGG